MFGLSLTKILFTVLVIVAVWRAFAYIGRLQAARQRSLRAGRPNRAPPRSPPTSSSRPATIDLVPCPSCGAYVPRGDPCRCRQRT